MFINVTDFAFHALSCKALCKLPITVITHATQYPKCQMKIHRPCQESNPDPLTFIPSIMRSFDRSNQLWLLRATGVRLSYLSRFLPFSFLPCFFLPSFFPACLFSLPSFPFISLSFFFGGGGGIVMPSHLWRGTVAIGMTSACRWAATRAILINVTVIVRGKCFVLRRPM